MKTAGYMFTILTALSLTAQAATFTWDGETDKAWMEATNWNPDGVPSVGNNYVENSGVIDPALVNFAGDSLTINSGAILRYTDAANIWEINIVTNHVGNIRNQHADRSVAGVITNLTVAGAARFLVDNADSSLTLDIDTLNFASGAAPYKYGSGLLVMDFDHVNATSGELFKLNAGSLDFDGAADTQVIGLQIDSGQYVLDEARNFASLKVNGLSLGAGTYTFADFQVAGKDGYFVDEGGSITIAATTGSEITWDDGDAGRSWVAADNWSNDQAPSNNNSYVISSSSAAAPADVYGDFTGGSLTVNSGALLRFVAEDATNFVHTLALSNATIRLQHDTRTNGGAALRCNFDGPAIFLVDKNASTFSLNASTLTFGSAAAPQKTGGGRLNLTAANDVIANGEEFTLVTGSLSLSGNGSWKNIGLKISGGQYDLNGSVSVASLTVGTTEFIEGTYTHTDFAAVGKGGSFIDNEGSITVVGPPALGYALWVETSGLTSGVNDAFTDNPDGDSLNNLYEYGLGGDPTNGADIGFVPTFVNDSGAMLYTHAQRTDDSSLSYYLEISGDLVNGSWANSGYSVIGTNVTGGTFDFVTNSVFTVADQAFVQLIIEQN